MKKNQLFGALTALEPVQGAKRATWLCLCACGATKPVLAQNLKSGRTRSCGCSRTGATAHGMSAHPAYRQYVQMVSLCRTYSRVPREVNKAPADFKAKHHVNRRQAPIRQAPRSTQLHSFGYVQRPIPIWPEVATFDLFWSALGPSWFPNSRLTRILPQPYAPHPTLDANSAMRVANLAWVPK